MSCWNRGFSGACANSVLDFTKSLGGIGRMLPSVKIMKERAQRSADINGLFGQKVLVVLSMFF